MHPHMSPAARMVDNEHGVVFLWVYAGAAYGERGIKLSPLPQGQLIGCFSNVFAYRLALRVDFPHFGVIPVGEGLIQPGALHLNRVFLCEGVECALGFLDTWFLLRFGRGGLLTGWGAASLLGCSKCRRQWHGGGPH